METTVAVRPELTSVKVSETTHERPIDVTPVVPVYKTEKDYPVASKPVLEAGYSSEEELDIPIQVVPLVQQDKFRTTLDTPVLGRPECVPVQLSETVYEKSINVTPMVPVYKTETEHPMVSTPVLEAGYSSEEEHDRPMDVVPMVPQEKFQTVMDTPIVARPDVVYGEVTETVYQTALQVTPMVPLYKAELEHPVYSQPVLEAGYVSDEEHDRPMDVIPMVPKETFTTVMHTPVPAHPQVVSGTMTEVTHQQTLQVVPMVPSHKTEVQQPVMSRPALESGFETTVDVECEMAIEQELTQTIYETRMTATVPAKPTVVSAFETVVDMERRLDVVPLVPKPEERFESSLTTEMPEQYLPVDMIVVMPVPPHFTKQLQDIVVEEGSRVVLEGSVEGKPTPAISWYRANTPLTASPDFRIEYVDGTVRLTLPEMTENETGTYTCEATNPAGRATSSANLSIRVKALAPKFIKGLENVTIPEGNTIRLIVKTSGKPKPNVKWHVNGKQIISSPDYVLEEFPDGVQTLTIPRCLLGDTGRYTVTAENEAGEAITSGTVTVLEPPRPTMPAPVDQVTRTELQVPLATPPPLQPRQTAEEGLPVTLNVEAKGNPLPFLRWYRNGQPLESSPDCKVSQLGPYTATPDVLMPEAATMAGEVEIPEVFPSDSGTLLCVAENAFGRAETSLQLDVQPKVPPITPVATQPVQVYPQKPWFSTVLEPEITVPSGSQIVLTTEAVGNPLPFLRWYFNGTPLEPSPECSLSQMGPKLDNVEAIQDEPVAMTGRLVLNEIFPTDAGVYKCVAENSAGQAVTELALNVLAPTPMPPTGSPPKFTKLPPPEIPCSPGETAVLEIQVVGEPVPKVSWYRSGIELQPSRKYKIDSHPETGIHRLTVLSVEQTDVCEYAFRATNEFGSVESVSRIVLKQS
ncbi:unnamed protein product [Dibothriocephalus latus]|uniref:Ig-like domain-containing protein n=1 Tax=Dibothriocephalus latus TaxID=60516 RepID=A0A3P7LH69_DIBLA|nr:unnamed protein product [Dibothriocephalus latus]